jgi:hypothetical protein
MIVNVSIKVSPCDLRVRRARQIKIHLSLEARRTPVINY